MYRNANLFVSRQCLYSKNLLDQNSSSKHPHNTIRLTQPLAQSKWPIKICGTRLVLKQFYCFLPITVLHSLIIELYSSFLHSVYLETVDGPLFFREFFEINCFTLRAAMHVPWICIKCTFSPPSPDINPTCYKPRQPPLGTNESKMAARTGNRTILKLHCSQPIRFNKPNRL